MVLMDFNKAFDSINHTSMLTALKNQGVPNNYTELIREMYTGLKLRIRTDKEGSYFEARKGVRQDDPLSSTLFNCTLQEVFKKLNWEEK